MLPWESTPQTWSPILTELIGIKNFLNNKILSLRPCRRPLWQTQASWLLPWRLDNILIASVACCVLLFIFALLVLSVGVFAVSLVSGFHAEAQAWVLLSFHDLRNSFFEFFLLLVVQERSLFISISRLFFCWLRSLNLSGWDWKPRIWYSRHCKNQFSQISDFLQFQGTFFMISDSQGTNVHGYCCLGWRLAKKLMTFHGDSGVIPDPEARVSLR